jgi:hypothetical protein
MSTVDGRPPAEIATPTPDLPRPSDSVENRARPDVPPALRRLAAWSWRLLVILAAAGLVLYLLILLKVIVVPVIVALFLATLLVPLVRWLEACGWRHIWAVLAVFLGAVLLIAGIVAGFVPLIGNELGMLRQRADEGVAEVQHYIASRPFGLSEADLNRYLDQARERFTENSSGLTRGAVQGVTLIGEVITGLILCLFLTFFLIKDSERFTRWILDFAGRHRERHLREIGSRSATAVSGYLRGQATVGLVDGVFIGIGLAVLGVPLVVPLAFLTFVAAFLALGRGVRGRRPGRAGRPGHQGPDDRPAGGRPHRAGPAARGSSAGPAAARPGGGPASGGDHPGPGRRGHPGRHHWGVPGRAHRRCGHRRRHLPARRTGR